MKKLFALLLCLLMACSCALAEELPAVDFDEASIAEIGGDWLALEQFGLKMYLPDIFTKHAQLNDEQIASGILAIIATEDQSALITIHYGPQLDGAGNQILSAPDLVNYFASNGYANSAVCLINGLEAANIMLEDRNMMTVVYFLEDGNALSFYYTPVADQSLLALFSIVSSSVMLAE